MVICHLPCPQGAFPGLLGEDTARRNTQFNPQQIFILPASQGYSLGYTTEAGEVQEQTRGGRTTCSTGKNPGSNSGLPQEAEGEIDHLPETP
jgi:hypothetical protein